MPSPNVPPVSAAEIARPGAALQLEIQGLPTETARALQAGAPDAYGLAPERHVAEGPDCPCRHCLQPVRPGTGMLILAHRPFPAPQPYAETGPIFLCADPCPRWRGAALPPILRASPDYLVRGYSAAHRIVPGTGAVVPAGGLREAAAERLAMREVVAVHIRSARNNCYFCRIVVAA